MSDKKKQSASSRHAYLITSEPCRSVFSIGYSERGVKQNKILVRRVQKLGASISRVTKATVPASLQSVSVFKAQHSNPNDSTHLLTIPPPSALPLNPCLSLTDGEQLDDSGFSLYITLSLQTDWQSQYSQSKTTRGRRQNQQTEFFPLATVSISKNN